MSYASANSPSSDSHVAENSSIPAASFPSLPRLSVLWLGSNLFWSAVMSQVLSQRVEFFVGDDKGIYLGYIGAAGALVSTLIQLIIGPISDNCTHAKGRRYVFVFWGVLLNTIPVLFFALATSFWQLMVAFVLIQLLLNIATGPFQAIIPDRVPREHQGKASGWMGVWQLIGQIVGLILSGLLLWPTVINFLLARFGQPPLLDAPAASLGVLLISALCAAVFLLCLFINAPLLIQPPLPRENAVPLRESLRDALDLGLKKYPDFAWLLASRAVINLGIYAAINFLRYYVSDELRPALPTSLAVMFIALAVTFGGVVSTLVAGKLADKASKRTVIYWSCGFAAVAALGFCLAHNFILACVIGLVFGIGYGAFCAVDWAFAANLMPEGKEGKYMAIFHIAFTLPQVLGLMLGGYIGTHFGYRAVFFSVPFYLIVGALLISRVRERHEIEAAQNNDLAH